MTLKDIVEFLGKYPETTNVTMLQCSSDNPMDDDVGISDVLYIESHTGETKLVLIPY